MNELMKKHKAAVAQVPPGAPTTARAPDTDLPEGPRRILGAVAGPAVPGTQRRVEWGTFEGRAGSCFSTPSSPRPPGTWLR